MLIDIGVDCLGGAVMTSALLCTHRCESMQEVIDRWPAKDELELLHISFS